MNASRFLDHFIESYDCLEHVPDYGSVKFFLSIFFVHPFVPGKTSRRSPGEAFVSSLPSCHMLGFFSWQPWAGRFAINNRRYLPLSRLTVLADDPSALDTQENRPKPAFVTKFYIAFGTADFAFWPCQMPFHTLFDFSSEERKKNVLHTARFFPNPP